MGGQHEAARFEALQQVITALRGLSEEDRKAIVRATLEFYHIDDLRAQAATAVESGQVKLSASGTVVPAFAQDRPISPKNFLLEKQPRNDVERVACLAYYLAHHRDTPHFKTLDISKLNTEAAQPKFGNPAKAASNAQLRHYLAAAPGGHRQLSAVGERFVDALPDRVAAKKAMESSRPRKKSRRRKRSSKPPIES